MTTEQQLALPGGDGGMSILRAREPVGTGTLIFREPRTAGGDYPGDANDCASRLFGVLSWKRPFDSDAEELFARHYLDAIEGMSTDAFGNRHCHRPYPDGSECKIAWSCHIDTCHHDEGFQRLAINRDAENGEQYVTVLKGEGNCLGADDGTGVWLLLEMLKAGKPGYYLFHRGEERGCVGSRWLKDKHPDLLRKFDAAIALDRKDFSNVITHQTSERCCSQEFAEELARQLGGKYKPDDTGAITDTKQYVDLIPECTNISVGYQMQHGPMERQYVNFALSLRKALIAADLKALPIKRDPKRREYKPIGGYNYHGGSNWQNPRYVEVCFGNEPYGGAHSKEYWVRSVSESRDILKVNAVFVSGQGWITKPMGTPPANGNLTVVPRKPPVVVGANPDEENVDPDELTADDELWLTMLADCERKLYALVRKYPAAATRLIIKHRANSFDLLCEHYGPEEWSNFMLELDEVDAEEDAKAGIDPAEDAEADVGPTTINGQSLDQFGICRGCMRAAHHCVCDI